MKQGQRKKWFEALNEEELTYLAAYCQVCAESKLTGKPSQPRGC